MNEVTGLPAMKILLPLIGAVVGGAIGYGVYKLAKCSSNT